MVPYLLLVAILSSNLPGKTVVRTQPGTLVPVAGYRGPLIADDANTVAHVTWTGTVLVDSKGNTWSTAGTVPQVAKSGKTPPGAGPFSDANYYSLGTGNDALDFAGDFSVCAVYQTSAADDVPFSNGGYGASGYYIQVPGGGPSITFSTSGVASPVGTAGGTPLNTVSVSCFGRSGSTGYAKHNLGPLVTAAAGTITAATSTQARLGRYSADGFALAGTIYEFWASTTTPSDALFTSIMQRVKLRAGITAW